MPALAAFFTSNAAITPTIANPESQALPAASLMGHVDALAHMKSDQQPDAQAQPRPQLQLLQQPLSTETKNSNVVAQQRSQDPRKRPRQQSQVEAELADCSQFAPPPAARPGSPGVPQGARAAHLAPLRSLPLQASTSGQALRSLAPSRMQPPDHAPLQQATALPPHSSTDGDRAGQQELSQLLGSGSGKGTSALDVDHIHDRKTASSTAEKPSSNSYDSSIGHSAAIGTESTYEVMPGQKRKRQRSVLWSQFDYEVLR